MDTKCIKCGDRFNEFQGDIDERTCMTCVLKVEDPDAIRPLRIRLKKKVKVK